MWLILYFVAVCKDSYVVYASGFDRNGKWEWFCESKWRCKNDAAKMTSHGDSCCTLYKSFNFVMSSSYHIFIMYFIGGSSWRVRRTHPSSPPPQGSRFFHFDIQNFWNVTASGVGAPPLRGRHPPTGNPGSATVLKVRSLRVYVPYHWLCVSTQ